MWRHIFFLILALLTVSFLVGCSDDDPVSPPETYEITNADYEDSADDFGETLADPDDGLLRNWMDPLGDGGLYTIAGPGEENTRSTLDTSFQRGDMTITINFTFYDADSNASEIYDSATTVRLTRRLTIVGTHEEPQVQVTIDHDGFLDVTGITPEDSIRLINGNGARTIDGTFQGDSLDVAREWSSKHEWITGNLAIHTNREEHPYPLGGDINAIISFEREVKMGESSMTFQVEIKYTISFDGTRYAHVDVEGMREFWIDLDTGRSYRERPDGP